METDKKSRKRSRQPSDGSTGTNDSPDKVIVLLSSLTELGVVRAVAKNGKTTERADYAKDFGTEIKALSFVANGLIPDGYRGHVEIIPKLTTRPTADLLSQTTLFD